MLKAWVIAVGVMLAAMTAAASDSDELKKAGLEGKWANDCTKAASAANVHATWSAAAGGKVLLTTDTDKKDDDPSTLVELKTMPGNLVRYTVKSQGDEVDVVLKMEKSRYRMWSSSLSVATAGSADEEFYVKDGKSVSDGKETEWYQKCEK
jgi:hypothetical protein